MNPSPLLLDNYYIQEIAVKHHSGIESDDKIIADDLKVDVREMQDTDNTRQWIFKLTIEIPETPTPKMPYTFRIVIVGFFEVSETYAPDLADRLARANGPAILYSAAREILATLTSRGFGRTVMLPSVNFLPPAKKQADVEPKKEVATEPLAKAVKTTRRVKRATKKAK